MNNIVLNDNGRTLFIAINVMQTKSPPFHTSCSLSSHSNSWLCCFVKRGYTLHIVARLIQIRDVYCYIMVRKMWILNYIYFWKIWIFWQKIHIFKYIRNNKLNFRQKWINTKIFVTKMWIFWQKKEVLLNYWSL